MSETRIIEKVNNEIEKLKLRIDELYNMFELVKNKLISLNSTVTSYGLKCEELTNELTIKTINWFEFDNIVNMSGEDEKININQKCVLTSGPFVKQQGLSLTENFNEFNFNDTVVFGIDDYCNLSYMFNGCQWLKNIDLAKTSFEDRTYDMINMFDGCGHLKSLNMPSDLSVCKIVNTSYMFNECSELNNIDLGDSFCANVACNFVGMFKGCVELKQFGYVPNVVDISHFAQSLGQNEMYYDCFSMVMLSLPPKWKVTNDCSDMFWGCSNLNMIAHVGEFIFYASSSNIINCANMFYGCSKINYVDLSGWNKTSEQNMIAYFPNMFNGCVELEKVVMFNWGKLDNCTNMFRGCSGLKEVNLSKCMCNDSFDCTNMFADIATTNQQQDENEHELSVITPAITMAKIITNNASGLTDINNVMKDKESVNNYKFIFKNNNLASIENYRQ